MKILPFPLLALPVAALAIFLGFALCRWVLRSVAARRFAALALVLPPTASVCLALYIVGAPSPTPTDYDPYVHGNPGRADFAATIFYGIVFPIGYLGISVPALLTFKFFNRQK